jgi:hypothetical protein
VVDDLSSTFLAFLVLLVVFLSSSFTSAFNYFLVLSSACFFLVSAFSSFFDYLVLFLTSTFFVAYLVAAGFFLVSALVSAYFFVTLVSTYFLDATALEVFDFFGGILIKFYKINFYINRIN